MHSFIDHGPEAQAFFDEHGYAVFTPRLGAVECAALSSALDDLLAGYAEDQGLSLGQYLGLISQWRDLWRCSEAFQRVLRDGRLALLAARLMGRRGARLLHDHVIAKPRDRSSTVPWHQDYPYWPVDTSSGLSCWCPLEDVDDGGGCLEVVDGSHLRGECPPVDFIADDNSQLDRHPDLVRLPVRAGEVVVLHSLTWHRTGPNLSGGQRRAYITLWLPPDARYAPAHAGWHPTNEHVSVAPGEVLNDDWFPCIGEADVGPVHAGAPAPRPGPDPRGLSMFSASQTIADQLRDILRRAGHPGPIRGGIGAVLASAAAREAVLAECVRAGIVQTPAVEELRAILLRLLQCSEAYRLHRARNVYNDAYVQWWRAAGARWAGLREADPAS